MVLPEPVWSHDDVTVTKEVIANPLNPIRKPWSKDKLAILRAVASCQARLGHDNYFHRDIVDALAQRSVCFLHSYSLEIEEVHY